MFPPFLAGAFFFSAWILMVFWGMVAPDLGISTLGYQKAMLVTIGLWLVVCPLTSRSMGGRGSKQRGNRKRRSEETVSADANVSATFSSSSRRVVSQEFKGGHLDVRFGEVKLDLLDAVIPTPPATLTIDAVFGGIEIIVPTAWKVDMNVDSKMGSVEDARRRAPSLDGKPDLKITGRVLFGEIKLKD